MSFGDFETSNGTRFSVRRTVPDDNLMVEDLFGNLLVDEKLSYATNLEGARSSLLHTYPIDDLGVIALNEEGKALGLAQLVKDTKLPARHTAYLSLFYRKGMHGVGIGDPLLESIQKLALDQGFKRLEMRVNSERRGARALYKRMGFVEAALLESSYLDPKGIYRDEVLFTKLLVDLSAKRPHPAEKE